MVERARQWAFAVLMRLRLNLRQPARAPWQATKTDLRNIVARAEQLSVSIQLAVKNQAGVRQFALGHPVQRNSSNPRPKVELMRSSSF